jgi:hypothetical protein
MMLYPLQSRNEETHRWCVGYGKCRIRIKADCRSFALRFVARSLFDERNGVLTRALSDGYGKEGAVATLSPQFRHRTY